MEQTYFLGANSKDGFYSLYGGFPADKNAFLHIIKGGPGTGKSGFMRALGDAAAWPIQGLVRHFREEIEDRIKAKKTGRMGAMAAE